MQRGTDTVPPFIRSTRSFIVMGLIIVGLSQCNGNGATVPSDSPNFIFILTDDQGWNGTSAHMDGSRPDSRSYYYETPQLERLVDSGMRFSSGYSPSPICTPSRRSIQFGQTPARQRGTQFESDFEPKGKLSIPLMLKSIDPNYVAAHFGKWGKDLGATPEEVGYDESDGPTTNKEGGISNILLRWFIWKESEDPKRMFSLTARALCFMEQQAKSGRPFFLQISHYATHLDMEARPETVKKYKRKIKGTLHRIPAFAAMTQDMDEAVGQVLDKMDKLGIRDNTYILFMADNGAVGWIPPNPRKHYADPTTLDGSSMNHPLRSGKWTLYEGGLRVPFIVSGPGIQPGSRCDVPVAGWDLLPTLSDLAGNPASLPGNLDGGSFRIPLENAGRGDVSRSTNGFMFHSPFTDPSHSAIRVDDYKLVKFWETDELELYNLREDIGETENLAQAMPGKTEALHQQLLNYLTSVGANLPSDIEEGGKY